MDPFFSTPLDDVSSVENFFQLCQFVYSVQQFGSLDRSKKVLSAVAKLQRSSSSSKFFGLDPIGRFTLAELFRLLKKLSSFFSIFVTLKFFIA